MRSRIFTWDTIQSLKNIVQRINTTEDTGLDDVYPHIRRLEERSEPADCHFQA